MSMRNPTNTQAQANPNTQDVDAAVAALATRPWIGAVTDEFRMFSGNPRDYTRGRPIGFGASSTVYAATYRLPDTREVIDVALKVVDLDKLPRSALKLLTMETQLMSLSKHPNVLRVRGTWLEGRKLYIALRLMRAGSISDCMRYKFTAGIDEESIRCILKQALEGLNYLHTNGFIHRDLKAANLLIDDDGTVLLGDLGVSASLTDEDAHAQGRLAARRVSVTNNHAPHSSSPSPSAPPPLLGKRKSFVGTPCWMAPEVISQKQYDSSADIWSLGITALELAQGRAPHSRDPPARVLAKILNNDPPTLDRTGGKYKYSRAFADVVAMCLCKDPTARPTAERLLALPFFRTARQPKRYLVGTLLAGLPPLADRQERRRQASIASHPSASSWDFSTMHTMNLSFRRSSASVHGGSQSPSPSRGRSHASVERECGGPGTGGLHFRNNSLRMRSLSIDDECEAQEGEEAEQALVLKGRRERERTRGREESITPLLMSSAPTAQPHVLVPEPDPLDLSAPSGALGVDGNEEANELHLDAHTIKNHSVAGFGSRSATGSGSGSGSGTGSAAGSSMVEASPPPPLAPPSSASLSSASSPDELAAPSAGTTPSSALASEIGDGGRGTIKVWRKWRGKDKSRKDSTSSAGTSRISGFFGTVLERKLSRK